MNDELKHKKHSIYGQLMQEKKLMQAWEKVKANKGAGGIDNITIEEYTKHEKENTLQLAKVMQAREYEATAVKRVYIPKKNGDKRPLGIPVLNDRIIQQAVKNAIEPFFEKEVFHKWSCGYRPDRGIERVMQIILWNIEIGYNHIYDCDIKGFFDNIPHKKLMKVINKYISDGSVLKLIWKWLKAGYMEEGKFYETNSGTPQGGVISPILANIYLNELDWELEKEGIHFVRYCDDFLLFAKTEEEIRRAGEIAKRVIEDLGLEVAINKTKFVDFNKDNFKFVGFEFHHWRENKKGEKYYFIKPDEKSLKDFKRKIKLKTQKTITLSKEEWIERVNPIIRGKVNYYLNIYKAVKKNESYGQKSHCNLNCFSKELHNIDMYTRQRLRLCMQHKHPNMKKAWKMCTKWNVEYFCQIGLVSSNWLYYNKMYGYTIEQYIERQTSKNKVKKMKYIEKLKAKGIEYYNEIRLNKMRNAGAIA